MMLFVGRWKEDAFGAGQFSPAHVLQGKRRAGWRLKPQSLGHKSDDASNITMLCSQGNEKMAGIILSTQ